jgi:hypothetical protein
VLREKHQVIKARVAWQWIWKQQGITGGSAAGIPGKARVSCQPEHEEAAYA